MYHDKIFMNSPKFKTLKIEVGEPFYVIMPAIELTSIVYSACEISLYRFNLVSHANKVSGCYKRVPYCRIVFKNRANI